MTEARMKWRAKRLAVRYFCRVERERVHYEDIEMRGGDSFEYGRKSPEEILTNVILVELRRQVGDKR